ncbi:hypothetical protein J2129_000648 [Methanofollis sp. W23]|uniref:hypothetical protein n=1 Tax=Methanofollis sp. W23 TaxID=2817849 RepID=UPI001AE439CA|nr:hypothetical protein [Methanofollis sp. W23]MBP2145194.1 hypothetical protein [Methanofollis sp. W23]
MDLPEFRTWVFLYLISSVALLWAAFLSAQGVMLWMSMILVLVVVGANFLVVLSELKRCAAQQEMMKRLSAIEMEVEEK